MERTRLFDEIMYLVTNASKYIRKYESIPRSYGTDDILYAEECHTIDMIGNNETISMAEIARSMEKTKSAISQIVDRLVKKGLLEKQAHPDNDRALRLQLTEKGQCVFYYHAEFDRVSYSKIMEHLSEFSDRELHTYIEIQKQINRCLKKNTTRTELNNF